MKQIIIIISMLIAINVSGQTFKAQQKKYSRVRTAYSEKETNLKNRLAENNISNLSNNLFLRVFKQDKTIEVWLKPKGKSKYIHVWDYDICSSSGEVGPKRMQGDMQVPEGIYYINRYNPYSSFYLSLGLNYPNKSDRILGEKGNLGGDIFIHGACVTIGCMPLTDKIIKELYILAIEAKNIGQSKVKVHIFPTKLSGDSYIKLQEKYKDNSSLLEFWANLKPIYDYFETNNTIPKVSINTKGKYILENK